MAAGLHRLGCRDYWSKYELGWHVSPTANQHDAITGVELALTEAEQLAGARLIDLAPRDDNGNGEPLITIVTDNGGPFRAFRFEAFIATHSELRHVRTRVRSPGQNGSRERGFGTLVGVRGDDQPGPQRVRIFEHGPMIVVICGATGQVGARWRTRGRAAVRRHRHVGPLLRARPVGSTWQARSGLASPARGRRTR